MKHLTKINELVESILMNHPETRNSDKLLLLKAWERGGLILTEQQKNAFMRLPSPESYRRERQRIQNTEGRWLPTKSVEQKRLLNQKQYEAI